MRKQRQQLQEHVVHVLLERLGLGGAHHPLDRPHGQRRVGGDLGGQLARPIGELGVGHHVVHQTQLERLGGTQRAPGEGDLGGLGVADHARQQPGAAALGQDAALGEAGVQLGRLGGDADVAAEGEVEAVAGGAAVQRADGGRVEVVQHDRRRVAQLELARVGVEAAQVAEATLWAGHLGGQVEPGAERPTGSR